MTKLQAYVEERDRGVAYFNLGEPSGGDAYTLYLSGAPEAVVAVPTGRSLAIFWGDNPFFWRRNGLALTVPSATQQTGGANYAAPDQQHGDANLSGGTDVLHFIRQNAVATTITIKFFE